MSLFICPVCGGSLAQGSQGHSLLCPRGHCYDLAREGYVNLLLSNQRGAKNPGDNKQMVAARRRFLDKGYYQPLASRLSELVAGRAQRWGRERPVLLDAGCGEGYYTVQMASALSSVCPQSQTAGIDISKWAVAAACRRDSSVRYAVDSLNHIPLGEATADGLTNIFAPLVPQEFHRVLRPGGTLILAIPGPEHLWELKSAIYDHPYPNQPEDAALDGFVLESQESLAGTIRLDCREDIASLFAMTPYFWKTSPADAAKLDNLSALSVRYAFTLLIYRRG